MTLGASVHYRVMLDGTPVPVRSLRTMVDSFLADRGVSEEARRAVVLAFSEALDNAWEHGSLEHGAVEVRLRYSPRFVFVSVRDMGGNRSPLGTAVLPKDDSERGRGVLLMRKLMDDVRIRNMASGGTCVSMMRKFERA